MLLDSSLKNFFEDKKCFTKTSINFSNSVLSFYLNQKTNLLWVADLSGNIYNCDLTRFDGFSALIPSKTVKIDLFCDEKLGSISSNESDSLLAVSAHSCQTRLLVFEPDEPVKEVVTKFKHKIVATTLVEDARSGQSIQLAAGLSKTISAIDCFSNKEFRRFDGHSNSVVRLKALQGCLFLSSSLDKSVRLWDMRVRNCIKVFEMGDNSGAPIMAVDSTGNCLSLGSTSTKTLNLFDLQSGRLVSQQTLSAPVKAMDFSPSDRILAVAFSDEVQLIDLTQIPAKCRQKSVHKSPKSKFQTYFSWLPPDQSNVRSHVLLTLDAALNQINSFCLN